MASIMLQYDRPTDHTRGWNHDNGRVRGWIARLLQTPGAVSFLAYCTTDGASPNTIPMLAFRTLEEARKATASDHLWPSFRRSGQLASIIPRYAGWSARRSRLSRFSPDLRRIIAKRGHGR
jgi:hypothetical protein